MPKRFAVSTIHVVRDEKTVVVKAGTTFDFTADELKDITRMAPDAVRTPKNEDVSFEEQEKLDLAEAKALDEANKAAKTEALKRSQSNPAKPNKTASAGDL